MDGPPVARDFELRAWVSCKHLPGITRNGVPKWGIRAHPPLQLVGLRGHGIKSDSWRAYQVSAHQPNIVFPHQAWSSRPIESGAASFIAMQARLAFAVPVRTGVIGVAHPPAKAMSAASANHRFNRFQLLTVLTCWTGSSRDDGSNNSPLTKRPLFL